MFLYLFIVVMMMIVMFMIIHHHYHNVAIPQSPYSSSASPIAASNPRLMRRIPMHPQHCITHTDVSSISSSQYPPASTHSPSLVPRHPPPTPDPPSAKADPRLMGAAAAGAAASGGLPMAIEMLTQAQFFAAIAKAGGGVLMFGPVGLISSTLTWTNFHAFWLQWDSRPVGECGGVTGTYMELAGTSITCISCLLTALILRWCDSLITKPHVSKRPQP